MVLARIRRAFARRPVSPRQQTARFRPRLSVEEFEPRVALACTTTPTQCFLSQAYRDVLNREIDPTGLAAWTQALNSGFTRQQVVRAITASHEYRTVVV